MMEADDLIRERLSYDPETGLFTRNPARGKGNCRRKVGTIMHNHGNRYLSIWVDGKPYRSARLAWFFVHGQWPASFIDHINGDGLDDRIANLRLATNSQNMANRRKNRNSKSPYKGVSFVKKIKARPWLARIQKDKKRIEIGYYATPEEAFLAYSDVARLAFGDFARFA